jgi:hypothetical protein
LPFFYAPLLYSVNFVQEIPVAKRAEVIKDIEEFKYLVLEYLTACKRQEVWSIVYQLNSFLEFLRLKGINLSQVLL